MTDDPINDPINKIELDEEPSEALKTAKQAQGTERVAPDKEHFSSLMQERSKTAGTEGQITPSLMDAVRDTHSTTRIPGGKVTIDSLSDQTQDAIKQIDAITKTLESPNIDIKKTAQQLLHSKLVHVNDSLRIALSKAGIEYTPSPEVVTPKGRVNPIERFLDFLADGQYQLENLDSELRLMGLNNKEISPVNMLAIQVKMGQITQELGLFTSLLSNALSSIKTIMNIQV